MRFSLADLSSKFKRAIPAVRGSVLGIDIGTSSIKVVQIGLRDNKPTLETYGDISLATYGSHMLADNAQLQPEIEGGALADLLHEINATSRRGGVALSQASVLTALAELPKRDEEQMKKIIGAEARRFIPVPMNTVTLDWIVIPDESTEVHAFDQLQAKKGIKAHTQKVLLVAAQNAAMNARMRASQLANVTPDFYEVEMFSMARACRQNIIEPSIIIDMGASTTKLYVVDEKGMISAVHVMQAGGNSITNSIAAALSWETAASEEAKRAFPEGGGNNYPKKERDTIAKIIGDYISDVFTVARGMIDAHAQNHVRRITRIIVAGGGAEICVPEIREHIHKKYAVEVSAIEPFIPITKPMILEEAISRVGPRYAVAIGLATRALRA